MKQVGRIQSIWRYPVKGMAGESMPHCPMGSQGLQGDRIWAVQDVARQEIQSCKFRPKLLQCSAVCLEPYDGCNPVVIKFPDGQTHTSDSALAHRYVSELIGYESLLQPLRPREDASFYKRHKQDDHTWLEELKATFEREPGEPLPDLDNLPLEAQENVSRPGTFFLVASLHILTTASLEHMHQLNAAADWDIARFRPNVMIETLPGMSGLVEQAWLDQSLRIGEAAVHCVDTAPRCGAVVRSQGRCGEDKSILRSIVKDANQNLGIYGEVTQAATISVGDPVYLI
ncbi:MULTISPECIES: MOSC domain-containing protein [unclassified Lentimonas]|uniref:MOSC domain-containing protein n=1 Tax=unclassified Lentimonas TaxID=2630993 RepID=UPI001323D03F|nr:MULTISPECIES: MOSC N-terminal beta barrel domain-containing protein [unclassified Lentimonas]CAA6689630.1 Unannotated [Lentimonas sp. CC19]CAA6692620.1 Unannotated [Lentimonas sp. CC10]CAA7069224.1 Unannotated [Lentimonas sp. CC11]